MLVIIIIMFTFTPAQKMALFSAINVHAILFAGCHLSIQCFSLLSVGLLVNSYNLPTDHFITKEQEMRCIKIRVDTRLTRMEIIPIQSLSCQFRLSGLHFKITHASASLEPSLLRATKRLSSETRLLQWKVAKCRPSLLAATIAIPKSIISTHYRTFLMNLILSFFVQKVIVITCTEKMQKPNSPDDFLLDTIIHGIYS